MNHFLKKKSRKKGENAFFMYLSVRFIFLFSLNSFLVFWYYADMNFSQKVIGHEEMKRVFSAMISSQKTPHAILLTGPQDIGKFRLAISFAAQINEKSPETVRQIEKNICADVITIGDLWQKDRLESWEKIAKTSNYNQQHRTGKNGAPKRTNTIGVEDIHAFLDPLSRQGVSPFKLGIIRDANRMTTEAANALLKTLEEPTARTIFILTAPHVKSLPETIVSRCQVFSLFLHKNSILLPLFDAKNIDEKRKKQMLMIAQGRSEIVRKFLEDAEFFEEERQQFQSISKLFFTPNEGEKMKIANNFSAPERSDDFLLFLENFTRFLRSILVEKARKKPLEIAQKISYEQILSLFQKLDFVRFGLRANANKRLLLEDFFLAIP